MNIHDSAVEKEADFTILHAVNGLGIDHVLSNGYAFPVVEKNKATALVFRHVEDHTDGNGFSILWLVNGRGTFFLESEPIELNQGDVIIFDDRKEHGFESKARTCLAWNFECGPNEPTPDEAFRRIHEWITLRNLNNAESYNAQYLSQG